MAVRKIEINCLTAPKTVGPYPQGVKIDQNIYTSMILPLNQEGTAIMGKDIANQSKQCIKNLTAILDSTTAAISQVVKLNVYLTNLAELPKVDAVIKDEFLGAPPARTVVGVAALPYNVLIAIDAVAQLTEVPQQESLRF